MDDLSRFVLILFRTLIQEFSGGNKNINKGVVTNDQSDECFLLAKNSHMRNKIKTNREKSCI